MEKKIGDYQVIDELGKGGNGIVYRVKKGDDYYALKTLFRNNDGSFNRFCDEINILQIEKENIGILQIIDSHIGRNYKDTWYVMPIAEQIRTHLINKPSEYIIQKAIELFDTLEKLHAKKIYHRDIKPQNIYMFNGRCVFSDFGLVTYPSKKHITDSNKKLGPIATIAPEMRWHPNITDPSKADLYSLSKTLWILLTGNEYAFDGIYDREDIIVTIEKIKDIQFYTLLHQFFEKTTVNDPQKRISLSEAKQILVKHLTGNFFDFCKIEWQEISKRLFNNTEPSISIWKNVNDIAAVFNVISKYNLINHFYFPSGGGLDVNGNAIVDENGFIRVTLGTCTAYLFKPKELIFCSINKNVSYNYFWLECEDVAPLFPDKSRKFIEDLVEYYEDNELTIVSRSDIDEDSYENLIIKNKGKHICRIFKGKVVITSKESIWNQYMDSYSGKHNEVSCEEFGMMLEKIEFKLRKNV